VSHPFSLSCYSWRLFPLVWTQPQVNLSRITGTLVQLKAEFTSSTMLQCFHKEVQFTDQSSGTITTYLWEYQNTGTTGWYQFSGVKDPTFKFPSTGTYDIRLTVSVRAAPAQRQRPVTSPSPRQRTRSAAFNASPRSGPRPLTVFFNDQSTGGDIISREWEMRRGGVRQLDPLRRAAGYVLYLRVSRILLGSADREECL